MTEALEIGDVVADKYRIERRIGEGGMGAVYEAVNVVTEKRVALKWITPEAAAKDNAVKRLLREAKLAARIEHPHVVDVYDVGEHADSVFLVMELLRGESLSDLYRRRGAVPAEELLPLLEPVLKALTTVHAQNIVHRDLKPANIFLCEVADRERPVPKLLDFGIARDTQGGTHLTGTGQVLGTPAYMAREQIDGGTVDQRTDVYALGVILYQGLVGRRPYVADTVFNVVAEIMAGEAVPPHEANPEVDAALSRVVLKAMARDRDERYATVAELARALAPFSAASDAGSSNMYPTVRPREAQVGASPWFWIALVAIGIAVVVAAVGPLLWSDAPEEAPAQAPAEPAD